MQIRANESKMCPTNTVSFNLYTNFIKHPLSYYLVLPNIEKVTLKIGIKAEEITK